MHELRIGLDYPKTGCPNPIQCKFVYPYITVHKANWIGLDSPFDNNNNITLIT